MLCDESNGKLWCFNFCPQKSRVMTGYSVRRDLQGEVRSRWVPGANGEKLRDRSTSKIFYKMINFQFIPRAGVISKGFFGSCMRLYIARRLIVCQEI